MKLADLPHKLRGDLRTLGRMSVERGVPPAWFGYRWLPSEPVEDYVRRCGAGSYEVLHPPSVATHPLPRNIASGDELPAVRGWWHYSFRDVPQRRSGRTFLATVPDCRIVPAFDDNREFWVTVVGRGDKVLEIREMAARNWHRENLGKPPGLRLRRATWLLERVFDNHSHWLTAHLPKFLLLQQLGRLDEVLVPESFPERLKECLRLYGIDPNRFQTFDPAHPVEVEELTLLGTDRFRPELLRLVQERCPVPAAREPWRRVFISRLGAKRRRLVNEVELRPLIEAAGFESVRMEELAFEAQIRLMRETAVLVAPHGAGLTNMMFCPRGTHVVEMADPGFPNPNFYAVAAAMGHPYWLVNAEGVGDVPPLEKDLRVDPAALAEVLDRINAEVPSAGGSARLQQNSI